MANVTEAGVNMASIAGSSMETTTKSANLGNIVGKMEGGSIGLAELGRGAEAARPSAPDISAQVLTRAETAPTPLEGIAAVAAAPAELRPGNLNLQPGDIPVLGANGIEGVQRAGAAPGTPVTPEAPGPGGAAAPEAPGAATSAAPAAGETAQPGGPASPDASPRPPDSTQPKPAEAQPAAQGSQDGKYFDDAEHRRRQGEDFQVAQGERTRAEVEQARADRAPQVAQERADAQKAEQDRQRAEHKDLKDMEAGGKPMTPEQHAKLLEYNKQEQARKTEYDDLKSRYDKGELTPEEIQKYENLRGEFNPEKQMTPEQMSQKQTELVNKIVNGENVSENVRQLSELRDKMDGEGRKLTPEEAKAIAERITNPETGNTEAQQKLREEIIEMMGIETQLVAQGAILSELRKRRSAAIDEARQAENEAKTNGHIATETSDPAKAMEGNRKVYDAYFKVWQIKAQITYTKLNAGRLVAEYYDKRQSVRRKLGVANGVEVVTDWVGAKLGKAGAEVNYQIDSVISESVLDPDEPLLGSFAA